jgi:hypothetical protein
MSIHSNLTGSPAVHQSALIAAADPGAVGAGKFWLNTATTPATLMVRNTGNTTWDSVSADAAHIAASAAVHGLPASVNVLGNRSAAGEFVQRSSVIGGDQNTYPTFSSCAEVTVTFPVAFSALATIQAGCLDDSRTVIGIGSGSNTGCTLRAMGHDGGIQAKLITWLAMGS